MTFFFFVHLVGAILLGITMEWNLVTPPPVPHRMMFIDNYRRSVAQSFQRPENAHLLFAFMTGDQKGISPYTQRALRKVNLSFLLSFSGIHLGGLLLFLGFFIKRIKRKSLQRLFTCSLLIVLLFPSGWYSVKRLALMRLMFHLKFLAKLKWPFETLFALTFIASFLVGHFKASPLSFIYSFLFLGTFFSLRDFPKGFLIMGLFATQLLLGIFMGTKVSLLSIPLGLLGSFAFACFFPLIVIFLGTFWLMPVNWIEPFVRLFVLYVHHSAKLLQGTFTSSSLFLWLAVWVLMSMRASKAKTIVAALFILLHTDTAMTPAVYVTDNNLRDYPQRIERSNPD